MLRMMNRLISVEDVRNYLSHIIYIYILIFDFFSNFLFVRSRLQTSVGRRYNGIREASDI